ncbi:MAG: zinc ribbon domain-containing protein [Chloroflexi bacterium]|nr:MAG: zinc ribbon domain-containing protein [Chloroflexota bacterium]
MPRYDYRCPKCEHQFEAEHSIHEEKPSCPACGHADVTRIITSAPTFARGMLTPAGTSRRSSKEELRNKWAEETPKLRKKLRDKLGEEAVKSIPSLNANYD